MQRSDDPRGRPDGVAAWVAGQVAGYPLGAALHGRRSRRFGPGMRIPAGPLAYDSARPPRPLTEDEEAALVFAAAGLTGPTLADLSYGRGEGGSMLAGSSGRAVASADSLDTNILFVINDAGTWLIPRPDDLPVAELPEVVAMTAATRYTDAYRALRVRISEQRASVPVRPGLNFDINRWSMGAPGSTYLLPVVDLTGLYLNALLEMFEPEMALFILDERRLFLPAGLARFGRSRGGHLDDALRGGRVLTITGLETSFAEAAAVEMGSMLHSIGLMAQALGLGGTCSYARTEVAWLEALGFDLAPMKSTRYVGAGRLLAAIVRLRGDEFEHPYAVGLTVGGERLLAAWCPPNHRDMAAAVRAFVDWKAGLPGQRVPFAPSDAAVAATIAYASYVHDRYGRFPAYPAPYRTVIGYQATHVDVDFYDRFYTPDALTETQRRRAAIGDG